MDFLLYHAFSANMPPKDRRYSSRAPVLLGPERRDRKVQVNPKTPGHDLRIVMYEIGLMHSRTYLVLVHCHPSTMSLLLLQVPD